MSDDLSSLPLSERVKRYRELATLARRSAGEAHGEEAKQSFIIIAKGWDSLANAAELTGDEGTA